MTTKTVFVPVGVGATQVDDFPDGCERSIKGALHIRPASMLEVTESEWQHISDNHKELAARLQVVSKKPAPLAVTIAPTEQPSEEPPTQEEQPTAEQPSTPESKPQKASSGKKRSRRGYSQSE